MSITFWSDGVEDDEGLNLSNANACDLLVWLGYEPDYAGELDAGDLAARCRRRLWPEARNLDPARPTVETGGDGRVRMVECGRPEGYLRQRTAQLLALADRARGGRVLYG